MQAYTHENQIASMQQTIKQQQKTRKFKEIRFLFYLFVKGQIMVF